MLGLSKHFCFVFNSVTHWQFSVKFVCGPSDNEQMHGISLFSAFRWEILHVTFPCNIWYDMRFCPSLKPSSEDVEFAVLYLWVPLSLRMHSVQLIVKTRLQIDVRSHSVEWDIKPRPVSVSCDYVNISASVSCGNRAWNAVRYTMLTSLCHGVTDGRTDGQQRVMSPPMREPSSTDALLRLISISRLAAGHVTYVRVVLARRSWRRRLAHFAT